MVVKRKSTKNPPMLSHEFVIQNHADIVACVAMVFVVGLMFQVSSPLASLFIALHHNVSVPMEVLPGQIQDVVHYTAGAKASFSLKLNDYLMPCPCLFTDCKMFCAGPNFLCRTKNLFTYVASHKHFVPYKKMICIQ